MTEKVISSEIAERIVNEQQLLDLHNISLEEWEIEKKVINTWESGSKGPDGEVIIKPLFQVKVWLKSKRELRELEQIRQDFKKELALLSPIVNKLEYPKKKSDTGLLLQINIFDLHFGKLAWEPETGHNYNIKIASQLFNDCVDDFINSVRGYNIERILLPLGNDFFNSDRSHPFNSTTAGTPQEEDTRWQNTFKLGRQLLVQNITKLSHLAPVDVVMIPGNHDFERNFYLGDSLEGWFSNNSNVKVNNGPSPRKYYKYGNNLIGFTHGNEEKVMDLPLLMAQEVPKLWSETQHREFHLGHMHHKKEMKYKSTQEYQGVIVRFMSSLTATDSWHFKKGFVNSKRTAEAYIWDKEKGLKATLNYIV